MRTRLATLMAMLLVSAAGVVYAEEPAAIMSGEQVDAATKTKVLHEIERYVKMDADLKGYFFIMDPRSKNVLRLTLDHVHDVVMAHPMGYAACADFKDSTGKVYDVDLVVDTSADEPRVREISLHKVGGKTVQVAKSKAK